MEVLSDSVNHHENALRSYNLKLDWWGNQISTQFRCEVCWLRRYECFCNEMKNMGMTLSQFQDSNYPLKIKVCLYYHYQEVGRSPNTAHVFEAISSFADQNIFSECEVIIFGDSEKESQLLKDINNDIESNDFKTCILYPAPYCKSIHDWVLTAAKSKRESQVTQTSNYDTKDTFRLVLLDGTY